MEEKMMRRITLLFIIAAAAAIFLAAPVFADPTGNNITYNADVTAANELVLIFSAEWGNNKYDDGHFVGFSYGLMDMFEIGGNWRLTEDEDYRHDPVFDAKFRFDLGQDISCDGEDGYRTTTGIAVGADNINFDTDKNGNIIPYIAYTHDFEGLRATAGYSFEEDNGAIFVGFDAETGDATLMWDWTQVNDGEDWNAAVGCEMPFEWFDDNWAFATHLAFSSNSTASDVWYVEFNYTIP
jgi:hypothetical protein